MKQLKQVIKNQKSNERSKSAKDSTLHLKTKDIRQWQKRMDADETIRAMSEVFAVMGDPTRLTILEALRVGECTVTNLTQITGFSQSAISHQLRLLRLFRLVRFQKQGRQTLYALDDDHVIQLLDMMRQHQQERK